MESKLITTILCCEFKFEVQRKGFLTDDPVTLN